MSIKYAELSPNSIALQKETERLETQIEQLDRLRERAELDRKFEESYFDTHTSELQSTETQPPDFSEEEENLPENDN